MRDKRGAASLPFGLTPREADVVRLMAKGLTNSQLAEELGIGVETAKTHVARIIAKTGTASRSEAVSAWQKAPQTEPARPDKAPLWAFLGWSAAAAALCILTAGSIFGAVAVLSTRNELAGPPASQFVYFATEPVMSPHQQQTLGLVHVTDVDDLERFVVPGITAAVFFDAEDLLLLPPGQLRAWYVGGVGVVAVNLHPEDLGKAVGTTSDQPFAGVVAWLPPPDWAHGEDYASYLVRTSDAVWEETRCRTSRGGSMNLSDRLFPLALESFAAISRARIGPSVDSALACQ